MMKRLLLIMLLLMPIALAQPMLTIDAPPTSEEEITTISLEATIDNISVLSPQIIVLHETPDGQATTIDPKTEASGRIIASINTTQVGKHTIVARTTLAGQQVQDIVTINSNSLGEVIKRDWQSFETFTTKAPTIYALATPPGQQALIPTTQEQEKYTYSAGYDHVRIFANTAQIIPNTDVTSYAITNNTIVAAHILGTEKVTIVDMNLQEVYSKQLSIESEHTLQTQLPPGKYFLIMQGRNTYVQAINIAAKTEFEITSETTSEVKIGQPVSWKTEIKQGGAAIHQKAFNIDAQGQAIARINEQDVSLATVSKFNRIQESKRLFKLEGAAQKPDKKFVLQRVELLEGIRGASELNLTENITLIGSEGTTVTYQTEGPQLIVTEEKSTNKKLTITADTHYENITAFIDIAESRKDAIKLYRTTNGVREPAQVTKYIDSDNNGLIEQIEWIVPHLSNQTYELELNIINPVAYLQDGDLWSILFETGGVGNLTATSPNALWSELAIENNTSIEELTYVNLTCGDNQIKPQIIAGNNTYTIEELENNSITPTGFRYENYQCNQTSTLRNIVNIAGYAEINLEYANSNMSINQTAIDPPSYSVEVIIPATNITVGRLDTFDFQVNVTCLGGTCGDTNVSLDPPTWWNNSWGYRRAINISNVGAAQTDFAVNINIDTENLINNAKLQSACQDLRFTNETNALQDHWIEDCDDSNSSIWINVSELAANTNTTLYIYYGNPLATSTSDPDGTFPIYINFTREGISGYGGGQDEDSTQFQIINDTTLNMWGNNWKDASRSWTIASSGTHVLEWQFINNGVVGEINGIGLDNDDGLSQNRHYQVLGTQNWGVTEDETYNNGVGGWQLMTQVLNDYTGSYNRLFFSNDADSSQATNVSYRDVRIRKHLATMPTLAAQGAEETTNKGLVSTVVGAVPFFTYNANPYTPTNLSCLTGMTSGESCIINWTVNATGAVGVTFDFFAYASNGNVTNNSEIIGITIEDLRVPEVIVDAPNPPATFPSEQSMTISANVTDNIGVSQVQAIITLPDLTSTTINLTNGVGDNYQTSYTPPNIGGVYTVLFNATDARGNYNDTETTTFNVTGVGSLNATITSPTTTLNVTQNSTAIISADITCNTNDCGNVTATLVAGNWWDTSFTKRQKIDINTSDVTSTLENVTILVKLNDSNINYTHTQNNGSDLRFVSNDNTTILAHDIEAFDESGNSYVWVKLDNITSSSEYIWIYYGNSGATDGQNQSGVWNEYAGVWLLTENSGTVPDSTGNNDGTNIGAVPTSTSPLGPALEFTEADDDKVALGAVNEYEGEEFVTFEAWFQTDGTNSDDMILAKDDTYAPLMWRDNSASPSGRSNTISLAVSSGADNRINGETNALSDTNWHHAIIVFDGDAQEYRLYLDGSEDAFSPTGHSYSVFPTSTADLYIGDWFENGGYEFDGTIADVRISLKNKSAAEAAVEYRSHVGTLLTYQGEESVAEFAINTTADTPIWTLSANPQNTVCLQSMTTGDTCSLSWTINATGAINETVPIAVIADSNDATSGASQPVTIRIVAEPINFPPTHTTPLLVASDDPNNYTSANLTVQPQNLADAEADKINVVYDWQINGTSINLLNMPMEAGNNSRDFARNNTFETINATWNDTQGLNGSGAYIFDGNEELLNDSDAGSYLNGLDEISISLWLKSDATGTDAGAFITEEPSGNDDILALRYDSAGFLAPGTNVIKASISTTGGSQSLETSNNTQTTDWQNIVVRWSSGENLEIFIDGVQNTPNGIDANVSGTINNVDRLTIGQGAKDETGADGWDGIIDEFRIYNRSLSDEQISTLYTEELEGRVNRTIVHQESQVNQTWRSCVTPTDQTSVGTTLCSNEITIQEIPGNQPSTLTAFDEQQQDGYFTYSGQPARIYANWTATGTPIALGQCELYTPQHSVNMSYDGVSQLWQSDPVFYLEGIAAYRATCNSTIYAEINATNNITIRSLVNLTAQYSDLSIGDGQRQLQLATTNYNNYTEHDVNVSIALPRDTTIDAATSGSNTLLTDEYRIIWWQIANITNVEQVEANISTNRFERPVLGISTPVVNNTVYQP